MKHSKLNIGMTLSNPTIYKFHRYRNFIGFFNEHNVNHRHFEN